MATNPYVNKVEFGNQTVMDISDTDATASDVLNGKKFYLGSGAPALGTAIGGIPEEELRDTVGWTCKNRLKVPSSVVTTTSNGVTFTVARNSEGEVSEIDIDTAGSVSTGNAYFNITLDSSIAGNYILSGLSAQGSPESYYAYGWDVTTDSKVLDKDGNVSLSDLGEGTQVNFVSGHTNRYVICVKSGQTISHAKIYPMIRYMSINDATFEPYHESVEEVIEQVYADNGVLGAKNLLSNNATSQTINGVTFTVNADGSVTANGTSSATCFFRVGLLTKKDALILNGANNGSVNTYGLTVRTADLQAPTFGYVENYDGDTVFVVPSNYTDFLYVYVRVPTGSTVNNVKFYPMLRLASDPDDTYVPYAMTNKELTDSLDTWTATSQVANEQVTFTGLDDTQGWGYDPRIWIDDNSTNLNPYCRINTITGAGTANMSITYDTDADNGAYVRLRIIK